MWWIPVVIWAMVFVIAWGFVGLSILRSRYYFKLEASKITGEKPPEKTKLVKLSDFALKCCGHKEG